MLFLFNHCQFQSEAASCSLRDRQNENCCYLGVADETILQAVAIAKLTLVIYDQKTIPPILVEWGQGNINHAGVIFIDYSSISPSNFGGLVKAIVWLWKTQNKSNWQNRIVYLQPN